MSTSSFPIPSAANELTPSQRLRLMRSTRKLGEMLGTTPMINTSSDFGQRPSASPRHSPAISLHHSSSLRLAHTSKKSKALPRPLVLSLQSRPASLSSPRSSASSTTPLSPTSISTNIDSSPSLHDEYGYLDDSLHTRRKRMAKLTRTLGENIPPELVFNSHPRRSRSRSSSIDASAPATLTAAVKGFSEPPHISHEAVGPNPPRTVKIQPPTIAISRGGSLRSPSPSFVTRRMMRKRHGHAKPIAHIQLEDSYSGRKSSDTVHSTVSSCSTASEPSLMSETRRNYRKQAGWSGEWNRQNMDEVMNRLRGLKAA
ncbi:hypothetical protein J3R30DRAFT_3420174 [Lentinula aciculospora]|uniref:Uncharacterized protein n=1 Tax=Lentinula aciculospora TaxID=153920 RepID=A0A9W9AWC3_9AGAR|nr:hypothetical protein J3R30DRAFT_3420174 [Lentinula aciculospora]